MDEEGKLNERVVTITRAYIPVDVDLALGEEVNLVVSGVVDIISKKENYDGTYDKVFTIRGGISAVVAKDENGKANQIQRRSPESSRRIP